MKKLLTMALLSASSMAMAHGPHGYYGYHRPHHHGYNWIAPTIIGGVIGYELARPPVYVQQQPVYVQPQPVYIQQPPTIASSNVNCTAWTETRNPDGSVTVSRTCSQ